MNLATHVLMGMAAYAPRGQRILAAAGAGGALPDLPAIALELWAVAVGGHTPAEIYRGLYFSPTWQAILAPWHSFPVWAAALGAARWRRSPTLQAGAMAGLLHLACDLPLHAAAPHRHLWPLSDWRFTSPVSSWHPDHFGHLVQPLELVVAIGLGLLVYRRANRHPVRLAVIGLWLVFGIQTGIYWLLP